MNTKPTISRFADRATLTVQPNTLAKAEEEGDSFKFFCISSGHYACESNDNTYIIIDKDGKIGCSCDDMTYRCTGNTVCKHIATFLKLDSPPQIPASGELVKKLMLMGWVGGKDDLHPAELLKPVQNTPDEHVPTIFASVVCPHCKTRAKRKTQEEADAWLDKHVLGCQKNPANKEPKEPPKRKATVSKTETVEPQRCGALSGNALILDPQELQMDINEERNTIVGSSAVATNGGDETMVIEEQTKTFTHPDGTTFPSAEELLDYADATKESADMKEINSLVTTHDSVQTADQQWSDDQIKVMKKNVAEKATPAEFAYFMEVARCSGLNPFLREIYFMKTEKGQTAIITGRDGYLTIAKRDVRFRGIQSMDVCENDEFEMGYSDGVMQVTKHVIKDFQDRGDIIGAWARGEMDGETPATAYTSIKEYDKGTNIWKVYKSAMMKKVPESMVLKRIAGISGLVTEAEVSDSQSFVMDAEEML